VEVELDGGPEVNGRQEVELEVDAGPEVNSMQELEVNGRQEVEVDGEQDVEQDVDGRQEVNRRQRRVGDEYAMDGIRLQSRRITCRHQVYCLQNGDIRCM
jgi:hypothetical protein